MFQYFEVSFEEIGDYAISLQSVTWLNYWYCFKELLSNFCLLIYMLIQRKVPYMWSLMEIRKAVNINGYLHLWNSVKFLFQNNYQDFFFFSKKDLGTLWTDGTSSKLSNMYAFMTSEKKGALSVAIMYWFFSLALKTSTIPKRGLACYHRSS